MLSAAEKGLAKKLLALKGRGSDVSNEQAAAARRVLDGQERAGDMELIREHFNVGRSYAGNIRAVTGPVQRLTRTALNVSRDLDTMAQGSMAAQARIVTEIGQTVASEVVRNRRTLIKIGEGVAETVGADPALASRFFNSLSRIAKVGGVVGTAAIAAYQVAMGYFSTLQAGADANRRMTSAFFNLGNRGLALNLEKDARAQVARENVLGAATGIGWVDEFISARRSAAANERMQRMEERVRQNRELLRPNGGTALAQMAAKLGVPVDQLTPEQQNMALDQAAEKTMAYSQDELAAYRHGKWADEVPWWERGLFLVSDSYREGMENQWREGMAKQKQEQYKNRREAQARAEMEALRHMSSTDRLQLFNARDLATASFSALRSRHKAIIPD